MADNEVIIKLQVEGNARVELQNATKAVNEFGDAAEKSAKQASGAFDVFKGVLAADAVKAGLELMKEAALKLFDTFIVRGVEASENYQATLAKLATQLKLAGDFSVQALTSFEDLATEIQRSSNVSDDAVLSQAAYVKSLGLSNEATEKLLRAAVELSAVTGKDLDSSVRDLAKSLEGQESKTLKLLEATAGLTKEQLKHGAAIDAISSRYGGTAAASTLTYAGGLHQISAAFEDVQKEFGNAITTNAAVISVFSSVAKALQDVGDSLSKNKDGMRSFVTEGVLIAIDALSLFVATVQTVVVSTLKLAQGVVYAQGVLSSFTNAVTLGFTDAGKRAQQSADEFVKMGETIAKMEGKDSVFQTIQNKLYEVKSAAETASATMRDGASTAADSYGKTANSVKILTDEQVELQKAALKTHEELGKQSLSKAEEIQKNLDAQTAAYEQGLITQTQYNEDVAVLNQQWAENRQKVVDDSVQATLAQNDQLRQLDAELYADKIAQNEAYLQEVTANEDQFSKNRIDMALKTKQAQDKIDQDRTKAGMAALTALATFQTAKSKELQAVGKAAAIAQATIQTYQGATGAFAALSGIPFVGPALAFAAAGAIIAAGLANVAQIAGVGLAGGIDSVPGTGSRDNFPAVLMPGERVVPTETNKDLTRYLAEQSGNRAILLSINDKLANLQNQVVVNVGGREIINEIQSQLDGGRQVRV